MTSPRRTLEEIDIRAIFPSLFVALDHLREDAHGAGTLLGVLNNIAYCLILTLVQGDVAGVLNTFATFRQHAVQYMQDPGSLLRNGSYASTARFIDIRQLNDLVIQMTSLYPSAVFDTEQDEVDRIDDVFISVLFNGAVGYLYEGDVDHVDTIDLIRGWNDGELCVSTFLKMY